uniref:OTU domain-containing protein n=1 Tax=Caenorhabditis tropicalis TaxID=1561998 RepID=A0A1I7TAF1_9PELO
MSRTVGSLVGLCAGEVASCLSQGTLPQSNWNLGPAMCNQLWEEFHRLQLPIETEEGFNQLVQLLDLTKMDTRNYGLTNNHMKLIKEQNLESFSLGDVSTVGTRDSRKHIHIDRFLETILNDRTREKLRHLDIAAFLPRYVGGWARWVGDNLQSLRSLVIFGTNLSNEDLTLLCGNLKHLQNLDISSTNLTSLASISMCVDLEILSIGGMKSAEKLDMSEMFELKKLRVLDLTCRSTYDRDIVKEFLKYDKVLPQLQHIDCSGTDATDEMVEKLVTYHPTLKMIGLVDTKATISTLPEVHLLNTSSLTASLEAFNHYESLFNDAMMINVVTSTYQQIKRLFRLESAVDKRNWFLKLCSAINEIPSSDLLHFVLLKSLSMFFKKDRYEILTTADRLSLATLLYNFLDEYPVWYKHLKRYENGAMRTALRILTREPLLQTPGFNFYELIDKALELLSVNKGSTVEWRCIHAIELSLKNMPEEIFENREFWTRIFDILDQMYRKKKGWMYMRMLDLIKRLADRNPDLLVEIGGVEMLIRQIKIYNETETFDILNKVLFRITIRSRLLESQNFRMLTRFLKELAALVDIPPKKRPYGRKRRSYAVSSVFAYLLTRIKPSETCHFRWKIIDRLVKKLMMSLHAAYVPLFPIPQLLFAAKHVVTDGACYWVAWSATLHKMNKSGVLYQRIVELSKRSEWSEETNKMLRKAIS